MILYIAAVVVAVVGIACIAGALLIRGSARTIGIGESEYGDVGLFLSGIALVTLAIGAFVLTYIVRNPP